jgi:predicted DsbA family dithiol-disulfide isomerase
MERTGTKSVKVEIVLDVICAASYIAFVRLKRAIERMRADGAKVEVAVKPFRLAPDADFDGKPLLDVLTAKFGEHVVAETRQAAADEVHAELVSVDERGIRSVPRISFNDGPAMVGARPEKAYFQALRTAGAGS